MYHLIESVRRARRFAREEMDGHGRHRERHEDHGHGGHGPHGRGRGGRHGGGRMFDQGELRFVMLHLISEKPRHGYELIRAIEEQLGGGYSPSPGVVYPTLTWLEEIGYTAETPTEGGRKLYAITEAGRTYLEANRATVDAVLARMQEAGAARASFQAPPIVRAMENLKLALRMRTSRGQLTDAELDAIATALDSAARAVERA